MDLLNFESKIEGLGLLGIIVTQNGEVLAKKMWDDECRRNVYSATKSFTSAAIGIAVSEGLIDLEEPLTQAFADDLPEHPDENLKKAKVRHLLTMCLGQENAFLTGPTRPLLQDNDWVKQCLAIPFVYEPGTHFVYNNAGPYLAGILLQRRCGCSMLEYLMPRLFTPLGIPRPTWETDHQGNTFGAGGLFLTIEELNKFGLLCLNNGNHNGKQLIPKEWLEECAKEQDCAKYSYLFWRGQYHSYRADGKYSQLSIILPEHNAVITTIGECRDGEKLRHIIYEEICTQL